MKGYCPHFREITDLEDCFFCYFKRIEGKVQLKRKQPI